MNNKEKLILAKTVIKVNYFLQQKFDKYTILEYIDGIITLSRIKYSDELLRCLFDLRQQFLCIKENKRRDINE